MQEPVAFGRFRLDFRTRLLLRDGKAVPVGPKVVETLMVLVGRPNELVTKAEIMDAVWPDDFVEEGNLTQNVHRLRRALAVGGLSNAIETMPGRGYRFVAPLESGARTRQSRRPLRAIYAVVLAVAAALILGLRPQTNAYDRLSPASRQDYRLGLYHLNLRLDESEARRSLRYFQQTAARDRLNPLGYAGMADAYLSIFDTQCDAAILRCPGVAKLAMRNAQDAVAVDARSAQAHTALAMAINETRNDDAAAEAEFRTAIALNPSYALAHHWYGNLLTVEGRYREATREHRAALLLEPASPATYAWLAKDAFLSHRYADAISYARQQQTLSTLGHPTLVLLGLSYERLGRFEESRRWFGRLPAIEDRALLAAQLARRGNRRGATTLLSTIDAHEVATIGAAEATAFAWLAVGDKTRALAFMRRTPLPNRVEQRMLASDPRWEWDANRAAM